MVARLYSMRDEPAVRGFLDMHPSLGPALLQASPYLKEHFGEDVEVTLEVVGDPEAEGRQELFAYIRTRLAAEEAYARLNRLDEEWFLDRVAQFHGRFNFNLEFV